MKVNFKNIKAQQFGYLTVLHHDPDHTRRVHWICKCVCGAEKSINGTSLRQGKSTSCGCKANVTHQKTHTAEYRIWAGAKNRCTNPNNPAYGNYGGRGITFCAAWFHSFETFLNDMGLRPSTAYSIDRVNNDGPYSPDNCQWATRKEQANNRRPRN